MKRLLSTAAAVVVLATTCASCDKIKPPQPELQKFPAMSGQQGEREAFAQTAQKELDELRSVISEFRTRAAAANDQNKARFGEELEKLDVELRETQQHLMALKSGTVTSWNQLKESFGKSLEKLKNEVDKFRKSSA